MEKTILVTGGAGFIGTNLIHQLISDNFVISVDNLITGKAENHIPFESKENFAFLKHDIINPIEIAHSIKKKIKKIDEIYHLACAASPVHYQSDPLHTLKTNFNGTLNVINLALEHGAKVVFSSTSEVYGSPTEHPQKESYWGNVNPNGIRSCYDEGKRVAESLLANAEREKGLEVNVARIFNTYGEYMNPEDGRVVTNFIFQALQNQPITLYGDGLQTRSFCYVSDMVNGIIKLMAFSKKENKKEKFPKSSLVEDLAKDKESKGKDTPKNSQELLTVNLGNPIEQTVKSLAEQVILLTGSKSKLNFLPLPQDDPPKRKPDITLAKKLLSWEPEVKLEYGLKKLIPHLQERISKPQKSMVGA